VTRRLRIVALFAVLGLAGCATPPLVTPDDYHFPEASASVPPSTPMIEYPPIEPVEPPVTEVPAKPEVEAARTPPPVAAATTPPDRPAPAANAAQPVTAPGSAAASASPSALAPASASASERAPEMVASVPAPPSTPPAPIVIPVPEISPDEQQMNALLADLHRYGSMPGEDARRELASMTQTFAKQRNDVNRVRLAVLYTVTRSSPQDDLRALQLLENVSKSGPGNAAVKQLAVVLHVQVSERVRAVRDEQQKADAAIQKLEALRAMERSLLRDRVRSGGGGGAGGGGSSGGAGGGSSGGGGG